MQRTAELTGADFTTAGNGGAPTVTFPTAQPAAGPATLARQALAPAPMIQPLPSAGSGTAPGLDLDDIYDHVASRLRRELLHDRERVGDLVGDLQPIGPPR